MKKFTILVVAVLICAAAWAGSTWYIGGQAESEYRGFIEKYARLGPITLKSRNYQRGFLSATTETVVEMTVPKMPTAQPEFETLQVVFGHDIYHGPLPVGSPQGSVRPALALIDTRIVSMSGAEISLDEILREVPELQNAFAHSRIGFDGSSHGTMAVPAFSRQQDDGTVNFGGLTAITDYAPGPGTLAGRIDMPNLEARFSNGSMTWRGIAYDFDLVEALPMLYVGTANMTFGGMEIEFLDKKNEKMATTLFEEMRVTSQTSYDGSMVHGSQSMVFDGITVNGKTYGPMELDLDLKNLDARALSDYQQELMTLYGEMDPADPDALLARMVPIYSDLALRLVAGSPEFNIRRLSVKTPMGEADGTVNLSYNHPQQQAPTDISELPLFIPFFKADADLSVDQRLVKSIMKNSVKSQIRASMEAARQNGNQQVPEMSDLELEALVNQQLEMQLQMFVSQGFIKREGTKLKSRLVFADGQLQVNGQPMPIFGAQ